MVYFIIPFCLYRSLIILFSTFVSLYLFNPLLYCILFFYLFIAIYIYHSICCFRSAVFFKVLFVDFNKYRTFVNFLLILRQKPGTYLKWSIQLLQVVGISRRALPNDVTSMLFVAFFLMVYFFWPQINVNPLYVLQTTIDVHHNSDARNWGPFCARPKQ